MVKSIGNLQEKQRSDEYGRTGGAGAAPDDNILKVWNAESGPLIARSLPL